MCVHVYVYVGSRAWGVRCRCRVECTKKEKREKERALLLGRKKIFFYDVIVEQKTKRSTIHYFCGHMYTRTFLKVHTRPRLAYALRCRGY